MPFYPHIVGRGHRNAQMINASPPSPFTAKLIPDTAPLPPFTLPTPCLPSVPTCPTSPSLPPPSLPPSLPLVPAHCGYGPLRGADDDGIPGPQLLPVLAVKGAPHLGTGVCRHLQCDREEEGSCRQTSISRNGCLQAVIGRKEARRVDQRGRCSRTGRSSDGHGEGVPAGE